MQERVITIKETELNKKIDSRIFDSHSSLAQSVSGFGSDLKRGLDEINKHTNQLDVMQYKIDSNNKISETGLNDINKKIESGFKDVNDKLENFVTVDQFWPVKTIVYGCLGIVLTAVLVASLALVITNNSNTLHATSHENGQQQGN